MPPPIADVAYVFSQVYFISVFISIFISGCKSGLWIGIQIGSQFNVLVVPDPNRESGFRIQKIKKNKYFFDVFDKFYNGTV
jgi:hypothetical protein